jgi:transcriptional regulator with XRE-family HTH domain
MSVLFWVMSSGKGEVLVVAMGSHPGDIGRRVRHRREELGLTRAEVADRAGIKESEVAFIEEEPVPVRTEILLRLAYALELPDFALMGSDADVPPGFEHAARHPRLDVLAEPECWRLLDDHGVGRIAFLAEPDDSPHVLPLNYAVRDHALVMRTREGSLLDTTVRRSTDGLPASFEVDHIDDAESEGWSVLLRGPVVLTEVGAKPADVEPWAGGVRVRQIRLTPRTVTGRRVFVG